MVDVVDVEDVVLTKRSDYMQAPCRESVKTCFCFRNNYIFLLNLK